MCLLLDRSQPSNWLAIGAGRSKNAPLSMTIGLMVGYDQQLSGDVNNWVSWLIHLVMVTVTKDRPITPLRILSPRASI
jgi:hypothetical protein